MDLFDIFDEVKALIIASLMIVTPFIMWLREVKKNKPRILKSNKIFILPFPQFMHTTITSIISCFLLYAYIHQKVGFITFLLWVFIVMIVLMPIFKSQMNNFFKKLLS